VGERQGTEFKAGHETLTGVARLRTWLGQHALSAVEIIEGPRGRHTGIEGALAGWDADRGLTALYDQHYSALVRQAWLLTHDAAAAQDIVQDSFVALHASWHRLRDGEHALCYLRQCVMSRSRSVRRRRFVPGRGASGPATARAAAEREAAAGPDSAAVVLVLAVLPARQREALVLRYYAGLSEPEIAEIMRISGRAVSQHIERALASVRAALDTTGDTTSPGLLVAS
jgi:RNA polymerase sigma factor (sigma-70 family)